LFPRVLLISLMFLPGWARADDRPLDKLLPIELVERCVKAFDDDDPQRENYAEELLARDGLQLLPKFRFQGMKCLKQQFGGRFFFDPERGTFVSEESERAKLREAAETKAFIDELREAVTARKAERQLEYSRRLRAACLEKLQEDEFSALTQHLCAEVFVNHGFEK
jgi:hypothetical protein